MENAIENLIAKFMRDKEEFIIKEFTELIKLGVIWIESNGARISNTDHDTLSYFNSADRPFQLTMREDLRFCFDGKERIKSLMHENAQLKEQINKMKDCSNCKYFDYMDGYSDICETCNILDKWEFNKELKE